MLLEVLKKLRDAGHEVYLILAGPDHYEGHLQQIAEEMNISESVRFLGWRNDVGELMRAADVCTASSIREGFGINLIEALYCGLPVIATDNRGHRMALKNGENGLLVSMDDTDAMSGYIEKLMQDERFRARYAGIDVQEYEADLVAGRIYDILMEEVPDGE